MEGLGNEAERSAYLLRKYEPLLAGFFIEDKEADWAAVGAFSETILGSGSDDELPSIEERSAWQVRANEPIDIFGRPAIIGN